MGALAAEYRCWCCALDPRTTTQLKEQGFDLAHMPSLNRDIRQTACMHILVTPTGHSLCLQAAHINYICDHSIFKVAFVAWSKDIQSHWDVYLPNEALPDRAAWKTNFAHLAGCLHFDVKTCLRKRKAPLQSSSADPQSSSADPQSSSAAQLAPHNLSGRRSLTAVSLPAVDELVGAFRPLLSVPRTFVAPNSDIIVPVVDPVVITPSAFPRLDQLVGGRGSQTWNTPIALFANNEDTLKRSVGPTNFVPSARLSFCRN